MILLNQKEVEQNLLASRATEEVKNTVISCIRNAIETDLPSYVTQYKLETKNGIGMQTGNFINTRLRDSAILKTSDVVLREFQRYGWKGKLLIDNTNHIIYSVMRQGRLKSLKTSLKKTPHYSRVLAYIVNQSQTAKAKQMSFAQYPYSQDIMQQNANEILGTELGNNKEYIYCIVSYETFACELSSCSISFIDKDLDIIESISLNDQIVPVLSSLTQRPVFEQKADVKAEKKSLLKVKKSQK